jgi:methionyl-tRNA synthetase
VIELKFYVTTPIYYVNDAPHIGHAYTTIAADILARWNRIKGKEVFFLTGLDEHGEKVCLAATEKGLSPQKYVDSLSPRFKEAWKRLNITNDDFIRTTEDRHKRVVAEMIKRINEHGDIYKGEYEGWYCVPCESFWTDTQLDDGKCPECNREVNRLREETYFFRLSKYQDRLLQLYEQNQDFVSPESRKNEIVSRVKEGLRDISITRKTVKWGIPFPLDESHCLYVWTEALVNYVSALGFQGERFRKFWPPDVELMAKEINWFHSVVWPAMLFSAGLRLPRKNFVHGWWTVEGRKMSKSLGNTIDPIEMVEKYGSDALRYYLFREVPFGEDGDFSEKSLVMRINAELADSLGNLLNRVLVLIEKNFNGLIPNQTAKQNEIAKLALETARACDAFIERLQFRDALNSVFFLVKELNRHISEKRPWETKDKEELGGFLYNLAEALRVVSILICPFMPDTADRILQQIGVQKKISISDLAWGQLQPSARVNRGPVLFRKISTQGML